MRISTVTMFESSLSSMNRQQSAFLDVGQHLAGDTRHANLGVTHGGGRVAIDGAKVALPIDKLVAEREVLGHTHDGVVDGLVPVWVVLTDDIAHDTGGFLVGTVPLVAEYVHRIENAPVNGL